MGMPLADAFVSANISPEMFPKPLKSILWRVQAVRLHIPSTASLMRDGRVKLKKFHTASDGFVLGFVDVYVKPLSKSLDRWVIGKAQLVLERNDNGSHRRIILEVEESAQEMAFENTHKFYCAWAAASESHQKLGGRTFVLPYPASSTIVVFVRNKKVRNPSAS